MQHDEFIGQVQARGAVQLPRSRRTGDPGHAGDAAERLAGGLKDNLPPNSRPRARP